MVGKRPISEDTIPSSRQSLSCLRRKSPGRRTLFPRIRAMPCAASSNNEIDARNIHGFKRYASHRVVRKQALRGVELRAVVFNIESCGRPIQITAQRRAPRRGHIFRKRHFHIHCGVRQTIAAERIGKAQQHGKLAFARRSRAGKNAGKRSTSFLHAFELGGLLDE